jgi:hypothetical protein
VQGPVASTRVLYTRLRSRFVRDFHSRSAPKRSDGSVPIPSCTSVQFPLATLGTLIRRGPSCADANLVSRGGSEASPQSSIVCNKGVTMRTRIVSATVLLLLAAVAAAFATDFAVIVNPTNPAKAIALADLGKMFKGKTVTWANGRNVTIVLREPSTASMKFIIEKVMGVDAEQGKTILADPTRKSSSQVVFLGSDEEIVKAVGTNPTAVGIVDVYNITGGVKVIKIDEKQPFDPGYVLKGR